MARLFSCGFELQSNTSGMEFGAVYGPVVETTIKHSGAAAFKHAGSILSTDVNGMDHAFSAAGATRAFVRYYFYIDALDNDSAVAAYYDLLNGTTNVVSVQIVNSGGTYTATTYYNAFGSSLAATFNVTTDVWHYLEIEYDSTPANGSEVLRVRLDGVEQASATNLTFTQKAVTHVSTGIFNGSAGTITGSTTYVDDIAVNDASGSFENTYPGAGNIVHLYPNGAGDNDGSLATPNGHLAVDETPTPDDGTTIAVLDANGDILDVNLESSASKGIGATDTIKLAAVNYRAAGANANGRAGVLRIKGQASGTLLESSTLTVSSSAYQTNAPSAFVQKLVSYVNPQDSAAWETGDLDQAQIGFRATDAAPDINISSLWLLVEYLASGTAYTQDLDEALVLVDSIRKDTTRRLLEAIPLVDTITSAGSSYLRTLTEALTIVDTVRKDVTRALAEALVLADSIAKLAGKALLEALVLVDTARRITTRSLIEALVLVDTTVKSTTRSLFEALSLSDTIASAKITVLNLLESLVLVDSISKSTTRTLSEAVTLIDTAAKATTRTLSEALVLVDSAVKSTLRSLTEQLILVDTFTSASVLVKNLLEAISLSDSVRKDITRTLGETLTLVDAISKTITRSLTEAITFVDTIRKTITRTFTETLSLSGLLAAAIAAAEVAISMGTFTLYQPKTNHELKDSKKNFTLYTEPED